MMILFFQEWSSEKRLKRFTVALMPINYKLRYHEISQTVFPPNNFPRKTAFPRLPLLFRDGREIKKQSEQKGILTQLSNFCFLLVKYY